MEILYAWEKEGHTNRNGSFLNVVVVVPEGNAVQPLADLPLAYRGPRPGAAADYVKKTYEP